MDNTTIREYVPWQTPRQNDERVQAKKEMLAARLGLPVTKISKSGDVLAYLLDCADTVEALGIQPTQAQA